MACVILPRTPPTASGRPTSFSISDLLRRFTSSPFPASSITIGSSLRKFALRPVGENLALIVPTQTLGREQSRPQTAIVARPKWGDSGVECLHPGRRARMEKLGDGISASTIGVRIRCRQRRLYRCGFGAPLYGTNHKVHLARKLWALSHNVWLGVWG